MDKFEAMQRFVLVAQSGSFTKAADILDLPKSSISSSIQALEKELGTRLFHRSTRSVTLTQDGQIYLPQCQTILAELEALDSQFQQTADEIKGTLRVDMPSRFASAVVIPNLPSLLEQYPNLQIKISSADYQVDPIKEGIDCVIRVGELHDSNLIAKPLTHYRIINCVGRIYAEQFGVPQTLTDLAQHQLIDYSHTLGHETASFDYVENGTTKQLTMKSSIAVSGTEAYLAACLAGLGIVQIPAIGAQTYLDSGELVQILPEYEAEPMPVSMIYPSRRQLAKRLVIFMDWLQNLMREKGY